MEEPSTKDTASHSDNNDLASQLKANPTHTNAENGSTQKTKPRSIAQHNTKRREISLRRIGKLYLVKGSTVGKDRWFELVLLFVVCFAAIAQLCTTVSNNRGTGHQTDQLITAAGVSAYAAQQNVLASRNFADSAKGINRGVSDAVERLQTQANAIELARETSEASSQTSLQATIDNFHQEQRAWVGLTPLKSTIDPRVDPKMFIDGSGAPVKPLQEAYGIINTGKTPARYVRVIFSVDSRPTGYVPDLAEADWMDRLIEAKIKGRLEDQVVRGYHVPLTIDGRNDPDHPANLAGYLFDSTLVPPGTKFFNQDIGEFSLGSLAPGIFFPAPLGGTSVILNPGVIIVFGEVYYRDIFSAADRVTKFCTYSAASKIGNVGACPVHNDMQ